MVKVNHSSVSMFKPTRKRLVKLKRAIGEKKTEWDKFMNDMIDFVAKEMNVLGI